MRLLPKRPERVSQFARKEFRLFPGGEVAALVDLVEVGEVWVDLLGPMTGGPEDLVRENREGHWEREFGALPPGRAALFDSLCVLPVEAARRGGRVGQPVKRDVVHDAFPPQAARGLSVEGGVGDLLVA